MKWRRTYSALFLNMLIASMIGGAISALIILAVLFLYIK